MEFQFKTGDYELMLADTLYMYSREHWETRWQKRYYCNVNVYCKRTIYSSCDLNIIIKFIGCFIEMPKSN